MADKGHEITEQMLKELEQRIAAEYKQAERDVEKKLRDYLEQTEAGRLKQKELLDAGKITQKEYSDWCYRHEIVGKRWEEMKDVLAADYDNAAKIALQMTKDQMPNVYALNANYGTYQIEHDGRIDTGFTLYNHDTAEYLLGDQRQLMPGPSKAKAAKIAADKNMQWNKQHIQSAVLQGVLQGESPYAVAERLRSVGQMNYNASVRYARTMTTSAQNAGRYESYRRAKKLGVELTIEWQATLDDRTRTAHRYMHGETTTVDEPFETPDGYTIYYPADCTGASDAPQHFIWNCRCTLLAWVKGFEGDTVKESPKKGDMSFEEWRDAKPEYRPYSSNSKSDFTSQDKPVTIKQPDIPIAHSLGAKRRGEGILDLDTGERFDLVGGSRLQDVTVFAGKGTRTPYYDAPKYASRYGGKAEDWQHVKGIGLVDTPDGHREASIHWSQCEGIGRKEMFIKEWLD